MDDKKKKYVKPEADLIDFSGEDIITVSVLEEAGWDGEEYSEE